MSSDQHIYLYINLVLYLFISLCNNIALYDMYCLLALLNLRKRIFEQSAIMLWTSCNSSCKPYKAKKQNI